MRRAVAGKARVHELAKELGISSKQVLSKLQDLGEYVKSPSSTVEAPVVRKLRESMAGGGDNGSARRPGGGRPRPAGQPAPGQRPGARPAAPAARADAPARPASGAPEGARPGPSGPRPGPRPGPAARPQAPAPQAPPASVPTPAPTPEPLSPAAQAPVVESVPSP